MYPDFLFLVLTVPNRSTNWCCCLSGWLINVTASPPSLMHVGTVLIECYGSCRAPNFMQEAAQKIVRIHFLSFAASLHSPRAAASALSWKTMRWVPSRISSPSSSTAQTATFPATVTLPSRERLCSM